MCLVPSIHRDWEWLPNLFMSQAIAPTWTILHYLQVTVPEIETNLVLTVI